MVKFQYLLNNLSGDALLLAKSYTVSDVNYPLVTAKLAQSYGNTDKIINKLLLRFTNLPPPEDNLKSLKSFRLNYQAILAQVGSIQGLSGTDDLVKSILVQKLKPNLQREILRQFNSTNFSLQQFGSALDFLVDSYKYIESFNPAPEGQIKGRKAKSKRVKNSSPSR